jgi:eukaryotic-like serine/threonine-protein kinase
MPHQTPLQPGDPRRVGRYRLAGRVNGIPAEGPIYLGTGPDGSEVTISVLHSDWTRDGAARDRFAAEAAVAKRVPPFCAARVLDAGLDGGAAFLISEHVPGRSLLEAVSADGVLSVGELQAAAIGMATGLASVHLAGLVHGHFGPEYVIMTPAGPRVIEFSITPPYGAATPAADMVAWAQTVVFAAAGRPPATLADLDVLPRRLREVVADCLQAAPAERPTARSILVDLIGTANPPAGVLAEGAHRAALSPDLAERHTAVREPALQAVDRPGAPRQARVTASSGRPSGPRQTATAPGRDGAHQHQAAGSRSRGRLMWLGVVVACAFLLSGVFYLLAQGGGSHGPTGITTLHHSTRPTAQTESASPGPTVGAPAPFAGSWSGRVTLAPVSISYTVTVNLTAGAPTGTIRYGGTSLNCSGALTVQAGTARQLTLRQQVVSGPCKSGVITLTRASATTLTFSFASSGPHANGTLVKQ